MRRLFFFFLLLSAATASRAQLLSYSLDTSEQFAQWLVSPERDMADAVPAVVPGTVFTAYVEAGREQMEAAENQALRLIGKGE